MYWRPGKSSPDQKSPSNKLKSCRRPGSQKPENIPEIRCAGRVPVYVSDCYVRRSDVPLMSNSMQKVSAEQIQQREKENPDNIDKVPVKTGNFHRRIVFRRISSAPRRPQKPGHQSKTDNHMERVQTRHHEINPVEN